MRAGLLRTEIAILAPPNAETPQDADGQPTAAWTTEATVNGEVTDGAGASPFVEDQYKITRQVRVRIRYYSTLTEKYRLSFSGRTVEILGVMHDARFTETVADCIERVA